MHKIYGLFFLLFLLFATGCSKPEPLLQHTIASTCTIFDMKQAACITADELVRRLAPYRVVFVGDHHSEPSMHTKLAELLKQLARSGRHPLLANEWFTPEDDPLLEQYGSGTYEGNFTQAVRWEKKAGYPFASYAPIYESIREIKGGLFGINMDKNFQYAISRGNENNMSTLQKNFVDALDMNLSAHRSLLSPFFAHCHARLKHENEADCRMRMYRVQVAWDSYMAQNSAALAQRELKQKDDLLLIFAGTMHLAYGLGINARFARRSTEPFVTILPVPQGTRSADVGEADFLLFYPKTNSPRS